MRIRMQFGLARPRRRNPMQSLIHTLHTYIRWRKRFTALMPEAFAASSTSASDLARHQFEQELQASIRRVYGPKRSQTVTPQPHPKSEHAP